MTTSGAAHLVRRVRTTRRVSIRVLLVTLMCLPLVAVGLTGSSQVASAYRAARADESRVAAINLVTQVDAARTAVSNAIVPGLASDGANDPALGGQLGIPPSLLPLVESSFPAGAVATQERAAERQLAAIDLRRTTPELSGAITALLASMRKTISEQGDPSTQVLEYGRQLALLEPLDEGMESLNDQLLGSGQAASALGQIQQLQLAVTLITQANGELPAYLTMLLGPLVNDAAVSKSQWVQRWASYTAAAGAADRGFKGDLAALWAHIKAQPRYQALDTALDPTAGSAGTPSIDSLFSLVLSSQARGDDLTGLLQDASEQAIAAVDAERDQASNRMWQSAGTTGGLILASLLLTILGGLAISRPLRRLADQANQISEGNLVEVDPSGPAEVECAGEALRATAASLRRVEAQAAEVAAGRLDSPLLNEPLPGALGAAVHGSIRRIIQAIHEREALQTELAHQAAHDPLTALPNRSAALRQIDAALARAARAEEVLGLLFVDLDGFKVINDTYGHAAGDRALQIAAERMSACVRAGDSVCRLGGDEFVVVVEDADCELTIVQTAHRIIEAVGRPFPFGEGEVALGASIGVAVSSDATSTADSLLAEADAAVYRAKASGRGRVEVFDRQLRASLQQRTEMELALRHALASDELALHYQPVVEVATGAVKSYEALIRWNRPGHGMVMPNDFIPVAESSGLICELGRWVLTEATMQLRRWTDERTLGAPLPTVSVNVSGRQLASPKLIDDVRGALITSGIDPAQLVLELTESVLVADLDSINRLHALKALGVQIALDDFGTGYTSIGQLGHFPLDILKIDRSFIAMLSTSDKLVQTMIQVAHLFSLDVVAEGVEDPDQLAALRLLECDAAQGYLFAKPQPPTDLAGRSAALAGTASDA